MKLPDDYLSHISDSETLRRILEATLILEPSTTCKDNPTHQACYRYENQLAQPLCAHSLLQLLLNLLASKPSIIDDTCQSLASQCFGSHKLQPLPPIILPGNLNLLQTSKTPTLTWIKLECLMVRLIKDQVYQPKCMSNEVLAILKEELPPNLRAKLASLVKSCVPHCQKVIDNDEEERNKWCEILDWVSWFIGGDGNDSD